MGSERRRILGMLLACGLVAAMLAVALLSGPAPPPPPITWPQLLPAQPLRPWRWIVIHHSATAVGGAQAFDAHHRSLGWDGLGYHFVVGNGSHTPLGLVEIGFRWNLQLAGAHAGVRRWNDEGIGICLVGDFTHAPPAPLQWQRAAELCAVLIRHLPGLDTDHIIGHREVPDRQTACPGNSFDLLAFRAQVQALLQTSQER